MTVLLLALLTVAFTSGQPGDTSGSERFQAEVETLALSVLESFPLQVTAKLTGLLPDTCSHLEALEQRFEPEERAYHLVLTARRDSELACAQVISGFEVTVPIVKAGLASGSFEVEAHGVTTSFAIGSLGDFPGFDLPAAGAAVWMCVLEPRLCFAAPSDWSRGEGLTWSSPSFLSARLGLRLWRGAEADPQGLLPVGIEMHNRSMARLGGAVGTRMTVSRDEGRLWSEHLFATCGESLWCEFWLEAPTEPLLDAAGEPFWRLVRFASQY